MGQKPYLLSDHKYAGFNQRMTDLQAALGAQMDRSNQIVKERARLAGKYSDALKEVPWLQLPVVGKNQEISHGFQSFPCLFMPEEVKGAVKKRKFELIEKINLKRNDWMD